VNALSRAHFAGYLEEDQIDDLVAKIEDDIRKHQNEARPQIGKRDGHDTIGRIA
jgi:hypothetical protein